jgi:O-acetyl-ADP-ribose deacetylase
MKSLYLLLLLSFTLNGMHNPTTPTPTQLQSKKFTALNGTNIVLIEGDLLAQGALGRTAIVNAANESLIGSAGVAAAIQQAAGQELISYIKNKIKPIAGRTSSWGVMRCEVGKACITPAFKLNKKHITHIIHAVGPDLRDPQQAQNKENLLRSAYRESLNQANKWDINTLSFPAISTGIFGYDVKEATAIAVDEVVTFLTAIDNRSALKEIRFTVLPVHFAIYDKIVTQRLGTAQK